MFKYFLGIALIFIIVACEPGLYCPEGQVKPRGSDVCVENTCISHTCSASNQECVVTTSGPKCECIDSEATIVNGACVNNTIKDVNCSNHGSLKYSSGQHYCECETGYQNLPSNKLVCIPRVFNCANTTCADGEIITLFENKASNGVNFVIIGDGYQTRDLARNGKFAAHAKKFANDLMGREPYKKYAKYINLYIVFTESNDSGIDPKCTANGDGKTGAVLNNVDTPLDACYYNEGTSSGRAMIVRNITKLNNYISPIGKTIHLKVVITNTSTYGGAAQTGDNIGTFPGDNNSALDIMYHEVGHAFGGLADEYSDGPNENSPLTSNEIYWINRRPNVDLTNDLNAIKWKHLIPHYNFIGAVEGGYYHNNNVWRPTSNKCIMKTLSQKKFCPVCAEAITKKIFSIVNRTYVLSSFVSDFPTTHFPSTPPSTLNTSVTPEVISDEERNFMKIKDTFTSEELEHLTY